MVRPVYRRVRLSQEPSRPLPPPTGDGAACDVAAGGAAPPRPAPRSARAARRHVGIGARPRRFAHAERLTRDTSLIRKVRETRRRRRHGFPVDRRHRRRREHGARVGIVAAARPVRPAVVVAHVDRAEQPVHVAEKRRVVHLARHPLVALELLLRLRPQLRREVDEIVFGERVAAVHQRGRRVRLRGRVPLSRDIALRHRLLFDRPDRLPRDAVEDIQPRLLARHGDDLARLPVDGDVREERRRRHVEVPDRVVHELKVPLALSGREIDAHQALGKQVGPGTFAAVVVRRRRLDRQVHEPEILVDRNLRPHADVAVDRPRVVEPRVVAELAGPGNRVERPQDLPRAHIVGAGHALGVVVGRDRHALFHRGADEDHVLRDDGSRVETDFSGLEIDLLAVAEHDADLHVDDAVLAERAHGLPGLRVERDEAISRRDVDDAIVAFAVAPVREPAARELTGRRRAARAFGVAVNPEQLAGGRVERDHGPAGAGGRVQHALDHQRRPFELVLRARAEAVGLEAPGHLEVVEVLPVDLIERRIPAAADIARVARPLAGLRRVRRARRLAGEIARR